MRRIIRIVVIVVLTLAVGYLGAMAAESSDHEGSHVHEIMKGF